MFEYIFILYTISGLYLIISIFVHTPESAKFNGFFITEDTKRVMTILLYKFKFYLNKLIKK